MSLFGNQEYCPSCMAPVRSANAECKACGFKPSDYPDSPRYLKLRTVIGERYLIGRTLGENTYTVTYMALDLKENKKKAVKEFSPFSFCTRDSGSRNLKAADGKAETFDAGLADFISRAEKLKTLPSHGIAKLTDIVKANGTAYAVFDFEEGVNLKKTVKNPDTAMTAAQIFPLMRPMIDSLIALHKENIFWGNISPLNIIISPDKKKATLTGFGLCAEKDWGEKFNFSPIIGFTPIEKYEKFKGNIGGWTDIYGICASVYYALTGTVPPDATDRTTNDTLKDIASLGIGISENKNAALIQGMEVYERDRFKAVRALYNAMYSEDEEVVFFEDPVPAETPKQEEKPAPKQEEKAAPKEEEKPAPKQEEKAAPKQEEKAAPKQEEKPAPKQEEKAAPKQEEKPAPSAAAMPNDSYSQVIVRRKSKDTVEIGNERYSAKLTKLELDDRNLTDDDTESMGIMRDLEYLSMNNNRLGSVEFIGDLKKLISFSAKNNFITDISDFINLGELRELYLSGNKELSDISVLEHLRGIRKLDLSDTAVTDIHPLIYLDHLKYLNLKGLKLTQRQIKTLYDEMPTCDIRYDS